MMIVCLRVLDSFRTFGGLTVTHCCICVSRLSYSKYL